MRFMRATPEILVVPLWIVLEVNQAITIVDLYLQQPQHPKSQKSRHLSTDGIASTGRIKRGKILKPLFQMTQCDAYFVGPEDLFNVATESLDPGILVGRHLGYFPCRFGRDSVAEGSRIDQKRLGSRIVNFGRNEQIVAELQNR